MSDLKHHKRVRRVLRHRGSQAYFKDGGWTGDANDARSFADIVEAAETCIRLDLSDVEMSLRMEDGGCEVFSTLMRN